MNKYSYDGLVMVFDTCVANHWKGQTMAPSENKARCNLMYQFKKSTNMVAGTKVTLPGKIVMVD